ncbi:MAG: copper resistance family protein [Acidobacteriaceae bacterium]|nr:copper resistance family protein [Acidobacteriaceae bacterium]
MKGTVLILSVLLSIVTDSAFALIVGTLLTGRWLEATESAAELSAGSAIPIQSAFTLRARRSLLLGCALVLAFAQAVRPWFLAASMSGSSSLHGNLALIPTILSSTHQGTLWYLNAAAIAAFLMATVFVRIGSTPAVWISLTCIVVLAFGKAATGHAADQGDFTLVEILQTIHILATAIWSGTILVSGLLIVPRFAQQRGPAAVWNYTRRLSKSATYALIAVLVSGIYTSDRELNNTLNGLWSSTWGKILIAKVAFVLLALCLGAISRFRYLGAEATPGRSAQLVRLLASEAVVMIVILSLSGLLGSNAPPMSEM